MRTRTRPLIERSLGRWGVAERKLIAAPVGSPERDEAAVMASEYKGRYVERLRDSKARLASVSRQVARTIAELHVLRAHRASLVPGSFADAENADEFLAVSADLVDLADEQRFLGVTIGPGTDTIAAIEARAT
jgi:hypothetical protein